MPLNSKEFSDRTRAFVTDSDGDVLAAVTRAVREVFPDLQVFTTPSADGAREFILRNLNRQLLLVVGDFDSDSRTGDSLGVFARAGGIPFVARYSGDILSLSNPD